MTFPGSKKFEMFRKFPTSPPPKSLKKVKLFGPKIVQNLSSENVDFSTFRRNITFSHFFPIFFVPALAQIIWELDQKNGKTEKNGKHGGIIAPIFFPISQPPNHYCIRCTHGKMGEIIPRCFPFSPFFPFF